MVKSAILFPPVFCGYFTCLICNRDAFKNSSCALFFKHTFHTRYDCTGISSPSVAPMSHQESSRMSYAWCQYIQYILETQKTGAFRSGLCVSVVGQEAERELPVPRVGSHLWLVQPVLSPLRKWSYWKGWLGHLENCDNKLSNYRFRLFKCPQESSGTFITFFHSIHSWKTLKKEFFNVHRHLATCFQYLDLRKGL